jgi:hypothetical protein
LSIKIWQFKRASRGRLMFSLKRSANINCIIVEPAEFMVAIAKVAEGVRAKASIRISHFIGELYRSVALAFVFRDCGLEIGLI